MIDTVNYDESLFRGSPYEHAQTTEPSVVVQIEGASQIVQGTSVLTGVVILIPTQQCSVESTLGSLTTPAEDPRLRCSAQLSPSR